MVVRRGVPAGSTSRGRASQGRRQLLPRQPSETILPQRCAGHSGRAPPLPPSDPLVTSPEQPTPAEPRVETTPGPVRHRTERDAIGRVWRFVYDPAAQEPVTPEGMVRIRCTTGTARATIVVRADWLTWPRQQLLEELSSALQLQRGSAAASVSSTSNGAGTDRRLARRRVVRDGRGVSWNCVFDPSVTSQPDDGDRVRVRCSAGRDRLELLLDASWHRLGDRQLADLISHAVDVRRR
jgi:hypothetical protein